MLSQVFILLVLNAVAFCLTPSPVPEASPWNATYTDLLKRSLLAGYDKFSRPSHYNHTTNVSFGMSIYHVQLDDFSAIMSIHGWVKLTWNDDKLMWNASDYGDLHTLHVADHEIWQPDVIQYNSASGSSVDQYGNTHCIVNNFGHVLWVPPTKLTSFCSMDLTHWPLDEHVCSFVFGSWTYDGNQIDLSLSDFNPGNDSNVIINEDYLIENPEWKLLNVSQMRGSQEYPCCPGAQYVHVQYGVRVQRRGATRARLLRAQAGAAAGLALLAHWMPPAPAPRALLAAAPPTLLAMALFYLADHLPATEHAPDIVVLYTLSLYICCLSAVVSVCVLNLSRGRRPLPRLLRRVLSSSAAKLFVHHDQSGGEELQVSGSSTGAGEELSPLSPAPTRAWLLLATFMDRLAFLLFFIMFVLLFLIYGC